VPANAPRQSRGALLVAGLMVAVFVGSVLGLAAILASGGGDDEGDAPPSALALPTDGELPGGVIVEVVSVPSEIGQIGNDDLRLAMEQAGRGEALGSLIDAVWIQGEAEERGIVVSEEEVSKELARLKAREFENDAEYERFLESQGLDQAGVEERVKLSMLGNRLRRRIGSKDEFERFLPGFRAKWKARTVCAPGYVTDSCSNGGSDG
jgi:SurA-like N-terminal domain